MEQKEKIDKEITESKESKFLSDLEIVALMLVKNGHNTELFNPFNYSINKLTHFHNLLSINENVFLLKQHTLYRALQQIINSSSKTKNEADRNYKKLLEEMQK